MAEEAPPLCCPECGAVLISGRLDGLCPVCLLDETEAADGEKPLREETAGPGLLLLRGYRIIREIARGGMGIIYEAEQAEPLRRVAVKMLLPHLLEDPGMRERFRSEVQAMAGLDHPGILPVYEVGDYNGLPYFTMKLAPGGNLAKNAGRHTGDWRAIATLTAHLADAIQTAHDHGVLHRDLKPANILFDEKNRACVSDFGIAKRLHDGDGGHHLTKSATILGTPNYLPPEWASGSAKRATTAGDIYGLGAILYELLTGDPPHTETHLTALLRRIADEPVTAPRAVNPKISRDLETICLKAIRKDPAHRYASASALAADLRNWLAGRPIQARAVTGVEKMWRWALRNPLPSTLAALLGLALTVGGAVLGLAFHTSRHHLHDALVAQAGALRESAKLGNQEQILSALKLAAAIGPSQAVREEYISALSMTGLEKVRTISYGALEATERVFTDAAMTCYTHRDEHGILTVRRLQDSSVISSVTASGMDPEGYGPLSPDGRYLCIRPVKQSKKIKRPPTDLMMYLWDVSGGVRVPRDLVCYYSCFSPDSRTLALGSVDGTISLLNLETGVRTGPFRTGFARQARPYCFSPDGTRLVVGQSGEVERREEAQQPKFIIMDTATGKSLFEGRHPDGANVRCAAWRPDGQSVFIGTENFRIYEWLMVSGGLPRQYTGHQGNISTLEVNYAGDTLLSQSGDKTTRLWSIGSAQTVAIIPCTGSEAHFAPGDDRFLCEDRDGRELREYKLTSSRICKEFSVPHPLRDEVGPAGCWRIIFSPDGGLLTAGDLDGLLHFDGITGVPLGKSAVGSSWSLQWRSDGSRLFSVGDAGLSIWPAEAGKDGGFRLLPARDHWIGPGNKRTLNHCALSGDNRVLTMGRKTCLELYDAVTGRQTASIGNVEKGLDAVTSNQDGSLAAVSQEKVPGVRIWDTITRQELKPIPTRFPQASVLFGRENSILFIGDQEEVSCWDARAGTRRWSIPLATRSSLTVQLAFPGDFSVLAVNLTGDSVSLLEPATKREIVRLRHASPHAICAIALSPDSTRLAVFCTGHLVQLWDLPRLRAMLAEQNLDWPGPRAAPVPAHVWRIEDP
ncbi:MAG: serine/threonine-protein kinase [Verrucomicrobiota bacterium]